MFGHLGDIVDLYVPSGPGVSYASASTTSTTSSSSTSSFTDFLTSLFGGSTSSSSTNSVSSAADVTTPQVSNPMTAEQQYGGEASGAGQYGTPGLVISGETQLPEYWPLSVPGFNLLRSTADGIYRRPIILPDSILPPALQRSNPFLRQVHYSANKWDLQLLRQAAAWQWIASHGGLKSLCRIPELGAPIWDQPPWEVMPSQGVVLREMFSIGASAVSGGAPFNGVDTLVGSFRVPIGYDGVLNHVVTGFTGTGFTDGSGSIVWRVAVGMRYAKNLGNILNSYGSLQTALLVPGVNIRLVSGQTVYLFASIPNGSPVSFDAQSRITMAAFGWTYPHR